MSTSQEEFVAKSHAQTESVDSFNPRKNWRNSSARARAMARFMPPYILGCLLLTLGYLSFLSHSWIRRYFGLSDQAILSIGVFAIVAGLTLAAYVVTKINAARALFNEEQADLARLGVEHAINDVAGPDDLMGLIRANRKQMDAYDALARSQAGTSYRSSQVAMGFGLVLLGIGISVAIFADSSATKYSAALITATGGAVGGYVAKTYLKMHESASTQMAFYFQQPLVQSYLLSAERLIERCGPEQKTALLALIIERALANVSAAPSAPVGAAALSPEVSANGKHGRSFTRRWLRRKRDKA